MGTWRRKLNSKRGASMIAALSFLLFTTIICSVIISAASGNVLKVRDRTSAQQAYYTLSSAASLLADGIDGMAYERVTYDNVDMGSCGDDHTLDLDEKCTGTLKTGNVLIQAGTLNGAATGVEKALKSKMQSMTDNVYQSPGISRSSSFTINGISGMEAVTVTMTMNETQNEDYDIIMTLKLKNTEHSKITLEYSASVQREVSPLYFVHNCGEDELCEASCTKTTTTVRWPGNPIVKEEEVPAN